MMLSRPAYLVALSCLYFAESSHFLLLVLGMSFQLLTTLLLKKFLQRPYLIFRLSGFSVLRVALTLSAALSNH